MKLLLLRIESKMKKETKKNREQKNTKLEILINFLTHFPRGSFYAIKVSIVLNNRLLEQDIKTHNKTNKNYAIDIVIMTSILGALGKIYIAC